MKEGILKMVIQILETTVYAWKIEVNTDGRDFNFDSQDMFRSAYEDCITKWKLLF